GSFDVDQAVRLAGRNDNWAVTTSTGRRLFLKGLRGEAVESGQRLRRLLAFEQAVRLSGTPELTAPRCLGWSEDPPVLVYELLDGARTGAELAGDNKFDDDLAYRAGRMVGHVHEVSVEDEVEVDRSPALLPPVEWLRGLP